AASYASNPTPGALFDAGRFFDLQVLGADSTDTLVASFYYPKSVTGSAEAALGLLYWNGAAWVAVAGSGGTAPAKNTTDDLDGIASGGRFSVTFDMTSTPRITDLTGTVFATAFLALEASIAFDTSTRDLVVAGPAGTAVSVVGRLPERHECDRD